MPVALSSVAGPGFDAVAQAFEKAEEIGFDRLRLALEHARYQRGLRGRTPLRSPTMTRADGAEPARAGIGRGQQSIGVRARIG